MGGDDVMRQLLFAQKNKIMVQISVEMQDGDAKQFTLSVLGVAAGRLRGEDQLKDAEPNPTDIAHPVSTSGLRYKDVSRAPDCSK